VIKLLYIAPISEGESVSGYTAASDGMLQVFLKMQHENIIKVDIYNNPYNLIIKEQKYDFCFINANPNLINNSKVLMQYKILKQYCAKLYLSIVWEAIPYPKLWESIFDSGIFDGYLCPSLFIKDLLKNKIKKNLFFYPHYINTDVFKSIDIDKKIKEDSFTVLTCGQLTERKSFEETIFSFCNALGDKNNCKLIIKSNRLTDKEKDIEEVIKKISSINGLTEGAIYSIKDVLLSQQELLQLYHSSSLFILPSKGEGFGLNIYEALSCGLNCSYSDFSAFSTLKKNKVLSNYNYQISGKIDTVKNMHHYGYDKNSTWFYPSLGDCINSLKLSYERWQKNKRDYFEQGLKNRQYIQDNFSYEPIKKSIINIFEGKEVFYG
jgi:glycosyltransferase involved in cell wall biosynthesis